MDPWWDEITGLPALVSEMEMLQRGGVSCLRLLHSTEEAEQSRELTCLGCQSSSILHLTSSLGKITGSPKRAPE